MSKARDQLRSGAPAHRFGPDAIGRPTKDEEHLNAMFAVCFGTDAGQQVLDYLEAITLRMVSGPEVSDAHLRHLEGQRFLVSIIKNRINLGKQGR